MTDDIIKIEQFQGNEVRVIVRNGMAAIPLVDIAKALAIAGIIVYLAYRKMRYGRCL